MKAPLGADAETTREALAARASATRAAVLGALETDELRSAARGAEIAGVDETEARRLVSTYARDAGARERLTALKEQLRGREQLATDTTLERLVLLWAARAEIDRVATLPIGPSVRKLFYDEFTLFAQPDARRAPLLTMREPTFSASCEVASLSRFPAGQLHWNVSGLPRSTLLRVAPRDLPRTLSFIATRMRGFAPAFFSHANGLRRNRFVWLEEESNRSYHRMASALALQPEMLGLVTESWFHDPNVGTTSPHLAWTNRVFLDNGGHVVASGWAAPEDGFLQHNDARRQAYERGEYRPRRGLVLWPRDAMLAWAERNPQFADQI